MIKPIVLKACDVLKERTDWGELCWYAGASLGNSGEMTVGRCTIKPGKANPLHSHPNCSEILVVLQGKILHTIEDGKTIELCEGDTVSIPPDFLHQAQNIGETDAILSIAFSSAYRKTVGE